MSFLKAIFVICIIFATATVILELYFAHGNVADVKKLDRIHVLPGQPQVHFTQYSGYIDIDGDHGRSMFYYFVEAEVDPNSKPLVLWLNGGPGASSVGIGAFAEHGPFSPSGDHLVANNYSWNKVANMLYLESPAGVGFSYSKNSSFYAYVDDEMTSNDNLLFLEKWLNEFPKFRNNDFYLTGESYAGHYLLQLADLILKSKFKINLKGIALGNPLLDFETDYNSRADYLWSHGLISDSTHSLMNTVCSYSQMRREGQQTGKLASHRCRPVYDQEALEIGFFLNEFDVTLDACISSVQTQSKARLGHYKNIDVCVADETFLYLNREDVHRALRARLVHVQRWTPYSGISSILHYNMQNEELSMIPILCSLVRRGLRVLAFSGDQDSVLPLTGTRILINEVAKELGLNTSMPYRSWFVAKQVAGWTQTYGGNMLSFATVRGGSHEVAFSQPERTLVVFEKFLGGEPLTVLNVTGTV